MGSPDASQSEMPGFSPPSWPGRELGEPLLDALLHGRSLPPDAREEARVVAEMLAELAGPAEPGELAGEAGARFGFARSASPAGVSPAARRPTRRPAQRPARRRRSWPFRSARPVAALIAAAIGLGGTAAAYARPMPGPIQDLAPYLIGAPPPPPADPPKRGPGGAPPGKPAPGRGPRGRGGAPPPPGPGGAGEGPGKAAPPAGSGKEPGPAGTAKAAGRARRKAKRTRRTRELAELQRLRQGGLLSSNEAGPHRLMPAEEAAVSTYDHYTTPVEPGTWDVPTAGATRFSWEYDGGRSRLLDLYQRGKDKQWDAAKRIDWSIPVDPTNAMEQAEHLVPIYGSAQWDKLSQKERDELGHHLSAWLFSQFLHGEQGALTVAARIVESVPDMDSKFYAATQAIDEARPLQLYARFMREKIGLFYPVNPDLAKLLAAALSDSRRHMPYLGIPLLIDGLALPPS